MSEAEIRAETFRRVRKVVGEVLKIAEERITLESRYREDLNADSFDNLSLFLALEEEFNRTIEGEGVAHLTTVGETVDFILGRMAGPAPASAS
ncbi:MAG TPA: acyl carrier protein [Thermoanaerobaculia bacterium]|jgi:acyl carrier protein